MTFNSLKFSRICCLAGAAVLQEACLWVQVFSTHGYHHFGDSGLGSQAWFYDYGKGLRSTQISWVLTLKNILKIGEGEVSQKEQTSIHKITKLWWYNVQHGDYS